VTALILQNGGHEVAVAYDGVTALERARAFAPDVVLLDIGLPGKSGFEVARALREDAGDGRPLLVAITGYGRAEDRAACVAAGFDHHFVKPVESGTLLATVGGAASIQPRRAEIS
jgi:CheY-like chemotaxis protein